MTKTVGKKKWQMKAPAVKFAIAHLHKHAFCGVHKYFIILLDGSVLFVSYLPFNDYSTNSTILQRFLSVKTDEKVRSTARTKIAFSTATNQSIKQIEKKINRWIDDIQQ